MNTSVNTLGKYQIVREIARSNDIVWEAVDHELGRRVAIKELNLPEGVTEVQKQERINRFLREAKAAGRLSHPNIVTIHEVGVENGRHYIVMEYLEGENLRERLQRQGAIPLKEAVDITLQVLAALEHAHRMGVVHRDIKPENIHLLPDGLVKLTDFGIARIVFEPNITIDGQIFGTPSYMSPEQIEGGEIDARTDIFSVGVVLYEMLTGRKPFTGESIVTITYNILHKEPTPPPGVPYGIERVLMRAMAKRPIDRYSSAREMAEDLKRAMEPGALVMPAPPPVVAPVPAGGGGTPATSSSSLPPLLNPVPHSPPMSGSVSAPPILRKPPPLPQPREPWLSPRESEAMKQMLLVVLLGLLIVLTAYGVNLAYERYVQLKRIESLNTQMSDGVKLAQAGNYREALARFVNVFQNARSDDVRAVAGRNAAVCLVHLGDEVLQRGRTDLALQYYQTALEYDPHSTAAQQRLDQVTRSYSGNLDVVPPIAPPPAVRPNRSSAEPPPRPRGNEQLAMELYLLGVEAYQRGDRLGAVDLWQRAIRAAPGSDTAKLAMESIQQITAR